MADVVRTLTQLQALLATTGTRSVSAQYVRDFLVSSLGAVPYSAQTGAYSATANDEFIACDATSAPFNVTLPANASAYVGKRYTVKKTDVSANAVTVVGTIDGATNYSLAAQYDAVTVVNTGSTWLIESTV